MTGWQSAPIESINLIGWTLVHFLWQGIAVAAVVAAALWLLKNNSPSSRYLTGLAGLAVMLCCPLVTASLLYTHAPHVAPRAGHEASPPAQPSSAGALAVVDTPLHNSPPPAQQDRRESAAAAAERFDREIANRLQTLLPWLVALWFAGVAVLTMRLFGSWLRLRWICVSRATHGPGDWQQAVDRLSARICHSRPVALLQSTLVQVPAVIGFWRPVILAPPALLTGMAPQQLEALFAHELAHIRRHDYFVNLCQTVVETLLFYHPVVWWLSGVVRQEREHVCDDIAVSVCGDYKLYVRALAALADLSCPPPQIALAARGGMLLRRVRRVLGATPSNEPRRPAQLAGLSVVVSVLLPMIVAAAWVASGGIDEARAQAPAAQAQDDDAESDPPADRDDADSEHALVEVVGQVVDDEGKAVADAEVWAINLVNRDPQADLHARTDRNGAFRIPVPEADTKDHSLFVWAYKQGYSLGSHYFRPANSGAPDGDPLQICLDPPGDTSFVVVNSAGEPQPEVLVEPWHVYTAQGYPIVPEIVREHVSARTDQAGRAWLPALQRKGLMRVQIISDRYGVQQQRLDDSGDGPAERTIRLRPVGRIAGRIVGDNPQWAAGVRLHLRTENYDPTSLSEPEGVLDVTTDAEGRFEAPQIAIGGLVIDEALNRDLPVRLRIPDREQFHVSDGETTELTLPLVAAVPVRGQINIQGVDRPIVGAKVSVRYGVVRQGDTVVSNEDGRFEARVLPGDVYQQVISIPPQYDVIQVGTPWNEPIEVPQDADPFDLPKIQLVPTTTREGRLVDKSGEPLGGWRVNVISGNRRYAGGKTDKAGKFELRLPQGIDVETYELSQDQSRATADIVTADPLVLRLTKTDEERYAFDETGKPVTMTGRVLHEGQPVAGARLDLQRGRRIENGGARYKTAGMFTTDEQGRYRITGLRAGDLYHIDLAQPFEMSDPEWRHGSPYVQQLADDSDEEIALPDMNLIKMSQSIAGVVVDPDGNPVAGARISANLKSGGSLARPRNGPPPWGETDHEGRFRLTNLPDLPLNITAYLPPTPPDNRIRYPAQLNVKKNQQDIRIVLDPSLLRGQ